MKHDALGRPLPLHRDKEAGGELADTVGAHSREQQHRITALASLAAEAGYASPSSIVSSSTVAPPPTPSATHTSRRRKAVLSLLILVIIVGASFGAVSIIMRGKPANIPPTIPTVLTLDLTHTTLQCPAGFVWSPNGRQLAAWGPSLSCQIDSVHPQAIIFDTHTGKELRSIDIASMLATHGVTVSGSISPVTALSYSPDGRMLVAVVSVYPTAALLLIPLDGGSPRLVGPTTIPQAQSTQWVIFDARNGSMASSVASLPPALSYQWTPSGSITKAEPFLSASNVTGRPSPSNGFTFWQDGNISPVLPTSGVVSPPALYEYTASPVLWSPNGQKVTFGANSPTTILQGVVAFGPSQITAQVCSQIGMPAPCHPTVLPPPDAAFTTVLHAIEHPQPFNANGRLLESYPSADIAWSANGKALATILPKDQFSGPTTDTQKATITVLSTATGSPLAHFTYQCPLINGGCSLSPSWSPSGAQLGTFVGTIDGAPAPAPAIVLWNTTALTH